MVASVRYSRAAITGIAAALAACQGVPSIAIDAAPTGCEGTVTDDPAFADALDALQLHASAYHIPGAALVVLRDGEPHVGVLGSKHASSCDPITEDTRFRTYLGMHVTAAATLAAIEEEVLALDAPVTDYTDAFGVANGDASSVTLRHVLSHRSLFGREFAVGCGELAHWFSDFSDLPLWAEPGSIYLWPMNSSIAALALAEATGTPFEEAIAQRVAPHGIAGSFDPLAALKADHASGYALSDSQLRPVALSVDRCQAREPYGGYFASARDLSALLAMHVGTPRGEARLDDAGPAFYPPERATYAGLLRRPLDEDGDWLSMSVASSGFAYAIRIVPDEQLAVGVLMNGSHGEPSRITREIVRRYTGRVPSFTGPGTAPEAYPGLVGHYRDELGGRSLRVEYDGTALSVHFIEADRVAVLTPAPYGDQEAGLAEDVFELDDDEHTVRLRFWRDERGDGQIVSEETIRGSLGPPFVRIE